MKLTLSLMTLTHGGLDGVAVQNHLFAECIQTAADNSYEKCEIAVHVCIRISRTFGYESELLSDKY